MTVLNNIQPAYYGMFENGFYLMLFKPDRIPPHIAIIANNRFYDLNVNGKNIGTLLDKTRLFAPTTSFLAIKLNVNESNEFISAFFAKYSRVNHKISCFAPVKDFFKIILNDDLTTVQFVYQLIPLLYKFNKVEQVFAYNVKNIVPDNPVFRLKEYTQNEIIQQIQKLKNASRVTNQ
jgi:hypothetical protein